MKLNRKNPLLSAITVAGLAFTAPSLFAASFTWDNSTDPGIQAGSGNWDISSAPNWTSDDGVTNVDWSQTASNDGSNTAIFAGTDGAVNAYEVTLVSQMAVESLTFNSSGYRLTGSTLALVVTPVVGAVLGTNAPTTVAANKTATINSILRYEHNRAASITVNNGSVLNLGGGTTPAFNPQLTLTGAGTVNITAGTFSNSIGGYNAAIMNQTGGTWTTTAQGTNLSASIGNAAGRDVNYTVSGTGTFNVLASNTATLNYTLSLGRAMGNFKSTLTLTGGTVNVGVTTDRAGQINLGSSDNNGNSLLDVQGGNLTVGTGKAVNKLYLFAAGAAAGKTATMTQSGGTSTLNGIQFGANTGDTAGLLNGANAYDASALATLRLSAGSLYVGAQGIIRGTAAATLPITIQLQGGTLGASQNWSSAFNMTLGTTAGGPTIRAQDSSTNARSITLSGILSNDGAVAGTLTKTGAGDLILSGTNTYTGITAVNTGTLLVNSPGSLAASSAVTVAAGASLGGNGTINGTVNASAGGQLAPGGLGAIGTLTLANNSATSLTLNGNALFFDLPNTVTTGDLIDITGAGELILNGANFITLNAPNGLVPEGTYTLMTYSARTGSGTLTFQNGATTLGNATINVGPTSVTLTVGSGGLLGWDTWEGSVSGVWDGGALNWKRGGIVSSAYVDGDAVTFDDSGSIAATISTVDPLIPVTPASVLFTNNAKNYTVSAVIAGGTTLTKTGSGTTILSGANTYTGKTTVSGGILQLTGAGKLGNSTYAGALDITPGATFQNASAGTQTLTGIVGTGGGIVSNSSGLILRNANNAYGTLNVTGGRVFIQSAAGALAASSTVNITTGGRLVLEVPGSPTYNQAISVASTAAGGIAARNASTLTNVTLPSSGSLTFNLDDQPTSTLAITNAQSLTGLLTVQVGGGAGAPGNVNLSGNITGASGALTKSGAGTLILSGANSYGGTTTVTTGTLSVTGSLGATAVTVNSLATLGGNGSIGGSVTIDSGATHALAVAANPGAQVTRAITGTLTLTSGNLLSLTAATPPAGGVYVLATAATITGTIDNSNINYNGITGVVSVDTVSSPNRILLTTTASGFSAWITGTFANGTVPGGQQGPNQDPDNDGISNLVEYAIADQDPTVPNSTIGSFNGTTLSYTKRPGTSGLTYAIQDSTDLGLSDPWAAVSGTPPTYVNDATTISYALTPGTPPKNFIRLQVISN